MSNTIRVRFLIDREQRRVVFAEAGSDFVDVLFSFLTLPLGRIVRLLKKQSCLGSLDSLYDSVEKFYGEHLQTEACREMLLNPRSAAAIQCEFLKIKGLHEPKPRSFYTCSREGCLVQSTCYYTYSLKCLCHLCNKLMVEASEWSAKTSEEGGTFVDDKGNFMITDDLRVIPTSLMNGLSHFKEMQIKEGSMLEERVIDFGTQEVLNLLGRSIVSKNALTSVCFPDALVEENVGFSLPIKEEVIVKEGEDEIKLKLVLNKENNNILYAEVGEDFINVLFSFLTFPLGSVFRLFSDSISLGGCIKNLYSSAENIGLECFKSENCRNMLLNPMLPTFYGCNKNQIPQLEEITSKKLIVSQGCVKCYFDNEHRTCGSVPCQHGIEQAEIIEWNPKSPKIIMSKKGCPSQHLMERGEVIEWNPKSAKIMADAGEAFVVCSRKYMISDNLHISPLSIISAVGGGMNSSISNMIYKEVYIDSVKARSLLGAMLLSKTVLTDVFSPKP
ncbi:hypothetical protein KSP39_PZI022638 [Platanthera zijinensis]|uniref:DUF674 family protein n=1 Tax=Platanthera zijinensis TaxID=2320716 RepID=A0AAP0AVU6_9ASPA